MIPDWDTTCAELPSKRHKDILICLLYAEPEVEGLAAYLVITAQLDDRERFIGGYGAAAAELTERLGGEYLVRAAGLDVLEGEHPGGSLVISKWPDKAAALAFWNSPEYAQVRKLREGIADCQVLLVEG